MCFWSMFFWRISSHRSLFFRKVRLDGKGHSQGQGHQAIHRSQHCRCIVLARHQGSFCVSRVPTSQALFENVLLRRSGRPSTHCAWTFPGGTSHPYASSQVWTKIELSREPFFKVCILSRIYRVCALMRMCLVLVGIGLVQTVDQARLESRG